MRRSLALAGAAAMFAGTLPAAAAQTPSPPAPRPSQGGGWVVDESGLTCAMARPVDPRVTAMVRTYPGSGRYELMLVPANWRWALNRRSERATVRLLPGETSYERRVHVTNLPQGRGEALNITSGGDFLQQFGRANAIKLTVDRKEIGTFQLPQAAAVSRVFAECEAAKLVDWGADPAALAPGATRPRPLGDQYAWARELMSGALDRGAGRVFALARLNVSREGQPERCTLMDSNRIPQVDSEICNVLMQKARFQPAGDTNGNGVPSVFVFEANVRRERTTTTSPITPRR